MRALRAPCRRARRARFHTPAMSTSLTLAHGLAFADLHSEEGLQRVDALFVRHLQASDGALAQRLADGRAEPAALAAKAEADLLLALAPHLEDFLADLFAIVPAVRALEARHHELAPLFVVKRQFVQRKAMNAHKADVAATFDGAALRGTLESLLGAPFSELGFANAVTAWQQDEAANAAALDTALRYAAWAAHTAEGRAAHRGGVLFRAPRKLDFMKLVPLEAETRHGVTAWRLPSDHALRRRDGFALTDHGTDLVGGLDQAHYCIWCHEQGKDSCARGLPEKKPAPGDVPFKKSPFNVTLAGCPLEERISEFHKLRAEGVPLGALAMICVDNPMVAATGHRICNDCMKSCIYQKQDPVDIPQSETRLLKDVLALPWGFEIYSLLTRWNPLDLRRRCAAAAHGPPRADRRHGARGLHARAPSRQRRPHGGRRRRPEDRAARPRAVRHHDRRRARAVRAHPRRRVADGAARRPADGRLRRRGRVRHHRALGQELPEDDPAAARAARPLRAVRRRALRRHARRRPARSRWASTTSRSRRARASRRCSTCPTASPTACARPRTS